MVGKNIYISKRNQEEIQQKYLIFVMKNGKEVGLMSYLKRNIPCQNQLSIKFHVQYQKIMISRTLQ